ncbi:MAG: hypothetical protein IRY93_03405 [Chthoniobacterales bacterium]|nr:hypothetical protein [Chthoniobacterales bacterium]
MHDTDQLRGITERNLRVSSGFEAYGLYGLLASLTISGFLIVWVTLVTGSFHLRAALFLFLIPWVLLGAGSLVTTALRLPSFFALDLITGVATLSVIILAWKVWVPLSLWILMILLLITVVFANGIVPRGRCARLSGPGLLAIIVSLVAATGWSQDLIAPRTAADGYVVFKPGADFFFHATIVARSLQARTLLQVGNYEWQGFPAFLYHYASYSVASCLAKAGDVSAYDVAVGFWAPFGSFLAGLASYVLARGIWNQGAGMSAVVATVLVPDAWLLNVAHPIYGYFWLQQVAPAESYALAIAGIGLLLIVRGGKEGRRMWITAGVATGALVFLFKAQIFVAAFPLLVCFAVLAWPPKTRWRWLVLGACVAAGLAVLPLASWFDTGPKVRLDFSGGALYWKLLAQTADGTPLESWYRIFNSSHPFPSHLAKAVGLTMLNGLGIFSVLAPLTWLLALWRKRWQTSEGISATAVAILLAMTFGLGGDLRTSELMHRPFVWSYWLVATMTAGRLYSVASARLPRFSMAGVVAGILALILVPIRCGAGLQRGKWPGAKAFCNIRLNHGFVDCARFIRSQPPANAIAQDSRLEEFSILSGLSERPSFAGRLQMWKAVSSAFRKLPYREQLQKLQNLQQATNIEDLQRSVRETGIRWYVVHPDDPNVWPVAFRDHPAFESHGYKVYDMQRCFDLPKN